MTREDVMVYSVMVAAFSLLATGFCRDIGFGGTAFAFAVIAVLSLIIGLLGYLCNEPSGYDTRGRQGD